MLNQIARIRCPYTHLPIQAIHDQVRVQKFEWADKVIGKWFDVIEAAANAGDPRANYVLGCLYAQGRWVERNAERTTDCMWKAAVGNQAQALKIMALVKGDFSPQRVLAETLI